eukprot:94041-Pelagomonas_calceolata.AAC.1
MDVISCFVRRRKAAGIQPPSDCQPHANLLDAIPQELIVKVQLELPTFVCMWVGGGDLNLRAGHVACLYMLTSDCMTDHGLGETSVS